MNFERPQEGKVLRSINWVKPDPRLEFELGEIERVAEHFGKTPEERLRIKNTIIQGITDAEIMDLTGDIWHVLENTDSSDIVSGNYARVRNLAEECGRDDGRLIGQMNTGVAEEVFSLSRKISLRLGRGGRGQTSFSRACQ